MNNSQILQGKKAIIFGAGGSIGSAVAKEFASEGAEVFLSGRTKAGIEELTKQIKNNGGRAHSAAVDALNEKEVNEYIDSIVKQTGVIIFLTGSLLVDTCKAQSP